MDRIIEHLEEDLPQKELRLNADAPSGPDNKTDEVVPENDQGHGPSLDLENADRFQDAIQRIESDYANKMDDNINCWDHLIQELTIAHWCKRQRSRRLREISAEHEHERE